MDILVYEMEAGASLQPPILSSVETMPARRLRPLLRRCVQWFAHRRVAA